MAEFGYQTQELQRFERALRSKSTELDALRREIRKWAGPYSDAVINSTFFHCQLYYGACLPHSFSRRSRARLTSDIRKATRLADQFIAALRAVWNSRDRTVLRWLDPVLSAYFDGSDRLPRNLLDPGFLHALDELWRRLALLDQALPRDVGGNRPQLAFSELARWLAGIYCSVAVIDSVPTTTTGGFFRYAAAVVDLLKSKATRFPKAQFDFPQNDEALRKALHRALRTQPAR